MKIQFIKIPETRKKKEIHSTLFEFRTSTYSDYGTRLSHSKLKTQLLASNEIQAIHTSAATPRLFIPVYGPLSVEDHFIPYLINIYGDYTKRFLHSRRKKPQRTFF